MLRPRIRIRDFHNNLLSIAHRGKKDFIRVSLGESGQIHADCIVSCCFLGDLDEGVDIESDVSALKLIWFVPEPSSGGVCVQRFRGAVCGMLRYVQSRL